MLPHTFGRYSGILNVYKILSFYAKKQKKINTLDSLKNIRKTVFRVNAISKIVNNKTSIVYIYIYILSCIFH